MKMIYGAGYKWTLIDGKMEPTYFLKRSESFDGLNWSMPGEEFIEPKSSRESTVRATRYLSIENEAKIIFSTRKLRDFRGGKGSYKLEQISESPNKIPKSGREPIKFANPKLLHNQNMLAYPSTFNTDTNYLFFNGSNFGKHSIFLARELN